MKTLALDLETYSAGNLSRGGVYAYSEDESFDILLMAYSIDSGPVQLVDLASGEDIPPKVLNALLNPRVEKWAYNASFERVCLSRFIKKYYGILLEDTEFLDPTGWRCSMVWATALGLPAGLAASINAANVKTQKLDEGKALIKWFCQPAPRAKNQAQGLFEATITRREPKDHPEKWEQFRAYNVRDVEAEEALRAYLQAEPLPAWVWEQYEVDQRVNDTGVLVDQVMVDGAITMDEKHTGQAHAQAQKLTGLDNPNSPIQLKNWLEENGCPLPDLRKQTVEDALATATGDAKQVLELRQLMARSSTKKYEAMRDASCIDGRARGLMQFYGAGRTGRWAGRRIQPQNLPRNRMGGAELNLARTMITEQDSIEDVELLFGDVPDTLSQLVRTALIPTPGYEFLVADYSAIEARVLAWLAGEDTTLDAFREGKDIYCATASAMFGVPVENHGVNGHLRQKGKIAVLACGYQGATGALKAMGAERMGLDEAELQPIVDAWRTANPHIVAFWDDLNTTALDTVSTGRTNTLKTTHTQITTRRTKLGDLAIKLPSGRELHYRQPSITTNRWGHPALQFQAPAASGKTTTEQTYGGKLTENVTQAVARDILADALTRVMRTDGARVVFHVHDEIVVEETPGAKNTLTELMSQAPAWAEGLPLTADYYTCPYYQKD